MGYQGMGRLLASGLSVARRRSKPPESDNRSSQRTSVWEPVYRSDAGGESSGPLVPLFPITSFVPDSPCPHKGPIPPGSPFVCMVCHQSGRDRPQKPEKPAKSSSKRQPSESDKARGVVYATEVSQ